MAIYTTLFLCESNQLPIAFPGWKLPLPKAVSQTHINPFTQEEMTVETREPDWDDIDPDDFAKPEVGVVPIEDDYDTYLENRIPQFVRSMPHWCAKNITSVELEPLVAATTGSEKKNLETALYAHPSVGAGIQELPNEFVDRLKSTDELTLNKIAKIWATEMSTPNFTHATSGDRIKDDLTIDEALSFIGPIATLAKKHQNSQLMYLLTEA